MSRFVLDTDMLTLVQEGHPTVGERFLQVPPADIAITVLTVEEQLSGWYAQLRKARTPEKLARIYRRLADTVRFLSRLNILTYDEQAIQRYNGLRQSKIRIGRMDLRIAATVLQQGATLVTRNTRDFSKVPGLALVD